MEYRILKEKEMIDLNTCIDEDKLSKFASLR